MRFIYDFILGLDAGVCRPVQRLFTALERRGTSAPGIHRDVSCVILAAIFVFCVYAFVQLATASMIYLYVASAAVTAAVETAWLIVHNNFAKIASRPNVQAHYTSTAKFVRSRMVALRLLAITYLVVSPFTGSFEGQLDLVGYLLVFLYGGKLYLMCCLPSLGDAERDKISLKSGEVAA